MTGWFILNNLVRGVVNMGGEEGMMVVERQGVLTKSHGTSGFDH